jgi:hypothetical protein
VRNPSTNPVGKLAYILLNSEIATQLDFLHLVVLAFCLYGYFVNTVRSSDGTEKGAL